MQIQLSAATLHVVIFSFDDFHGEFTRGMVAPPQLDEHFSWDDYMHEKHHTEELLRAALSRHWSDHDDFEVAWDENFAFTLCGSIYSARAICRDYLEILHGVLRSTRHRDRWAYSTSVELSEPIDGMTMCDFVLQGNRVTISDWELHQFDLIGHLSRPRHVG